MLARVLFTCTLLTAGAAYGEGAPCGTAAFPRFPASVYERAARMARPAAIHRVGERETLWIYNYQTEQREQVVFTYRAIGAHCAVLVADELWPSLIGPDDVARMVEVFEHSAGPPPGLGRGIYEILTEAFAPVAPVLGDSIVYIAIAHIKSALDEGFVVGYTSPNDRLPTSSYPQSNERALVVIDGVHTSQATREETLAHEFFHVIHTGLDPHESRWIDEGIAVYAQTLCGYPGASGAYFFKDTAIGLFDRQGVPSLADYDKAYLLVQYMADRYGPALIEHIVRSSLHGIPGVDEALAVSGFADRFARDVFPAWAVANLSRPRAGTPYAYVSYDPLAHQPSDFGGAGLLPIYATGTLPAYGVRYFRADADGARGVVSIPSAEWAVRTVRRENEVVTSASAWEPSDRTQRGDCTLAANPWLVIAAVGAQGGYSLRWERPIPGSGPQVAEQTPVGTGILPHEARIRATFSGVAPDWQPEVRVIGERSGELARGFRIERTLPVGECAATFTLEDTTAAPLPENDLITVTIGDVPGPFGGVLPGADASWQFRTGASDAQPPQVTIGLLGNPVLPEYLAVVVLSDEALYPDAAGPVRLIIDGTETVLLRAQDAAQRHWIGAVTLAPGTHDILVRAADLAGNPTAGGEVTYAVTIAEDGEAAARLVRGAR